MPNILVFGDSVAYGFIDTEGGWVVRLKKYVTKKSLPKYRKSKKIIDIPIVQNLGRSGNSTQKLVKSFTKHIDDRLFKDRKTIVIFQIGINDSYINTKKGKTRTSSKLFTNNLNKLISHAKKLTNHIIILGLTPVDEEKTSPIPWSKHQVYKNRYIKNFNEIIKRVCTKEKVQFVDIFSYFNKHSYKEWLEDGLHPNNKGHKKIYKVVKKHLIKAGYI